MSVLAFGGDRTDVVGQRVLETEVPNALSPIPTAKPSFPLDLQNCFHCPAVWTRHWQIAEQSKALPTEAFWKGHWNRTGENVQTNEIFRNRMVHLEQ